MTDWCKPSIEGVLLDITGVLYESGSDAIPGSIDAVKRLKALNVPLRFCSNETTKTREKFVEKLQKLGFDIKAHELFTPIPAVCQILKNRDLRPLLIINDNAKDDFHDIEQSDPNCVVMCDAGDEFSYENLNRAFQLLLSLKDPVMFALGMGKYYKEDGKLVLDVGPYMKALEFAGDIKAEVVGKPSKSFFDTALADMGLPACGNFVSATPPKLLKGFCSNFIEMVVMIGDDIVNDVGGAQACGMRGIQVRTGKFRPQDENHPTVKPDGYVDNLAEAVDIIIKSKSS